ncbi:Arm DNA-binding domain-containing protein [Undibacterium luofuense]|uniref:DUF4102 domain-containing protein n=1 Tax=Undibacterium luofuense TaxID=2828733 RepID=A0A941I5B3_9BURK|nr:Arm DNA-binding domain-containing protein [Undibacterium luofuense]MBR7782607.1 DUF4102 domain-containing protein [Undibacterium luofuense]
MIKPDGLPYIPKRIVIEEKREKKRIARIESKEQFELALNQFLDTKKYENSKAGSKLNLGDGLSLHVSKNKIMKFYFIYCIHGSGSTSPIGKYPTISFDEARSNADELKKELLEEKGNSAKLKFRQNIKNKSKKLEIEKSNENEIQKLSKIFFALIKNIEKIKNYYELEINAAIYLILHFPEYGIETLRMQKDLFKCPPFIRTVLQKHEYDYIDDILDFKTKSIIATNSNGADVRDCLKNVLISLNNIYRNNEDDGIYFFPNMKDKSEKEIHAELNNYISTICPNTKLDFNSLPNIFHNYLIYHSGFTDEFINSIFQKNQFGGKIFGHDHEFYRHQIKALRSWWHERLLDIYTKSSQLNFSNTF